MNQIGNTTVSLVPGTLDVDAVLSGVSRNDAGATVLFTGTARDHSPGRPDVTHLEYEAYIGEVEPKVQGIVDEARERWPILDVSVSHRTGTVAVGDVAVAVAVSAGHRDAAFAAARYIIDELKSRAPIWKKEHWSGGAEWVEGA